MCGIVGYVGSDDATPILMQTLRRLEYRGYDSVGIATSPSKGALRVLKAPGRIDNLAELVAKEKTTSRVGIGHSRWATHGEPSASNAHPHYGGDESLAIVHNGVIENHDTLRNELESKGYCFRSETDSEVIAHLVDYYLDTSSLETDDFAWRTVNALNRAVQDLEGSYAIVLLLREHPSMLFAARRGSPLVVGTSPQGSLVGSDAHALRGCVKQVTRLDDNELAIVRADSVLILTKELETSPKEVEEVQCDAEESSELLHFPHYTFKEIYEQPGTLTRTISGALGDSFNATAEELLANSERICIAACGTSWHAGLYAKYILEELADIPVDLEYASEIRYRQRPVTKGTTLVALSQSGETADTLAALRSFKAAGQKTVAVCNVQGSTMAKEADAALFLHAGQESGVAATKTYTAQLALLAATALRLAKRRGTSLKQIAPVEAALRSLPMQAVEPLKLNFEIAVLAKKLFEKDRFLFVGRGYDFATALEGALKLKETSYLNAEGYAGGELKHGPLALVDSNTPTIAVATQGGIYDKMLSNIQEIAARGGPIIAIANEQDTRIERVVDHTIHVPQTLECLQPILNIIPLQLLAYHVAVLRECDVDRPRNLAKSVTVE